MQALATSVRDKALPLAGAALWSGHVLPARRAGTVLDLKASSHKKLSKLLQARRLLLGNSPLPPPPRPPTTPCRRRSQCCRNGRG